MHQSSVYKADLRITSLYIHPVKSLAGISVSSFALTDRGPEHDRRWMLVDPQGRFLTQREYPQLTLLATSIQGDTLVIYERADPQEPLMLPLRPAGGASLEVTVWEDTCEALHPSPAASAWLSLRLGITVMLIYMPEASHRRVEPDYARNGELTSFSDGYPLLLIGQASLDDLNTRLPAPVAMERFRPNIVFSGGSPYQEDSWLSFCIGPLLFHAVKPCARCVLTTIDPITGERGPEPLRTLATYRSRQHKVLFGMNLLYEGVGHLSVGDPLQVVSASDPTFIPPNL